MNKTNPLDPYAWEKEKSPFEASPWYGGTTWSGQVGVHTTPDPDIAMLYAVRRAGFRTTPMTKSYIEKHGSNAGVILVLDVDDLEPLPDIDAEIASSSSTHLIGEFLDREDVQAALDDKDTDTLIDILEGEVEIEKYEDELWTDMEKWDQVTTYALKIGELWQVFQALANLGKENPNELLEELNYAEDEGKLSYSICSDAIKQRRYMEPIGIDRLIKIIAIRPVRLDVLGAYGRKGENEEGYPEEDLDSPQIFSRQMIYKGNYKPDMIVLWENEDYKDYEAEQIDYHGTDLTRTQKAFPELTKYLVSPWPYTQE